MMVNMVVKLSPANWNRQGPEDVHFFSAGNLRFRLSARSCLWSPPTDVYEVEEAVIVRVEVAGMREDDFMIRLDGRLLTIRGTRPDFPERRAYHQLEIPFGDFISEVELPVPVMPEKIEAVYQSGFLKLVLPKANPRLDWTE